MIHIFYEIICKPDLAMEAVKDTLFLQYGFPEMVGMSFSVKNNIKRLTSAEFRFMQHYRKHNNYVKNTVPKDDLLIWNVKVLHTYTVLIQYSEFNGFSCRRPGQSNDSFSALWTNQMAPLP